MATKKKAAKSEATPKKVVQTISNVKNVNKPRKISVKRG